MHIRKKSSNFAAQNQLKGKTTMQTDAQHQLNETPITTDVAGNGNVQKKYYTADEAIAFLEPRIRAMFQ
ncbi:MAG: hypothetical protein IJ602_01380 [Paludibacteraceae bacterium]|nr:hypothetical protein [Paludibacteraceae bacterium]MBR1472890.1 hypothetical protein [Paludibacteraceae bacterium]